MAQQQQGLANIGRWKGLIIGRWQALKSYSVCVLWLLIKKLGEKIPTDSQAVPDLCAQTEVLDIDPYTERFDELLLNRASSVKEIAVTAPYSSGKTSILLTYQNKRPNLKFANISLGAFHSKMVKQPRSTSEGEASANQPLEKQELASQIPNTQLSDIEKSILQQLFYRAQSHQIPLSRFQRISPKSNRKSQSYIFSIWATSLGLMMLPNSVNSAWNLQALLSFAKADTSVINPSIWILSFLLAPIILFIKDAFGYLKPITITKLNPLKADLELSTQAKEDESVFNKHFEEIIYFFQVTKTDVVVFEDLDRFGQPDIFVKLKELNGLLNNAGDLAQHPVRFIYALKDDVFKDEERTKFFDAIIPIIPVAHNTNSYSQLKKLCENSEIAQDFSDQLLRDVSFYLHDMRMIKNIVSEYLIYKKVLQSTQTDLPLSPLFALIIYKNFYAEDFAKLHRGEGVLAGVLSETNSNKMAIIDECRKQKTNIDELIQRASSQFVDDINLLNLFCLVRISLHWQSIPTNDLINVDDEQFLQLKKCNDDFFYIGNQRVNHNFRHLFNQDYPEYDNKRTDILNSSNERKQTLVDQKDELLRRIENLNQSSLSDMTKENKARLLPDIADYPLLQLLIQDGYIDEKYYRYLSHSHAPIFNCHS